MRKLVLISFLFIFITSTRGKNMADQNERVIHHEVIVNAGVEEVYKTWTTKEGLQSFFAPECEIDRNVQRDTPGRNRCDYG